MNRTRIVLACVLLAVFAACAIPLGKRIADAYVVRSSNQKELAYVESLNDKLLLLRGIRDMSGEIETLKQEEAALDRDLDKLKAEIATYEDKIEQLQKDIRRYEDVPVLPDTEYLPPEEFIAPETDRPANENEDDYDTQGATQDESE